MQEKNKSKGTRHTTGKWINLEDMLPMDAEIVLVVYSDFDGEMMYDVAKYISEDFVIEERTVNPLAWARIRRYKKKLSEEEKRQKRNTYQREYVRKKIANMTPEELAEYRRKSREYQREYDASLTKEERMVRQTQKTKRFMERYHSDPVVRARMQENARAQYQKKKTECT